MKLAASLKAYLIEFRTLLDNNSQLIFYKNKCPKYVINL